MYLKDIIKHTQRRKSKTFNRVMGSYFYRKTLKLVYLLPFDIWFQAEKFLAPYCDAIMIEQACS